MQKGIILLMILVIFTGITLGQVPHLINYQGVLIEPSTGQPVADDTYSISLSIYDVASGGSYVWTETQSVETKDGVYNVLLGSITALTPTILDGPEKYLGIKVGIDPEMTPRKRIVSVAYAIVSEQALNSWNLIGNSGTTPGTNFLGTTDENALELKVNSQRALRLEPATSPNIIGGKSSNIVSNSVIGATISGGEDCLVTGNYGTVGGGLGNESGDKTYATIAGGSNNLAKGSRATIAGGEVNIANGNWAFIGGGEFNSVNDFSSVVGGSFNSAIGTYAMVPGGRNNKAAGKYSFAAGRRAKANHPGTFVWADTTDADFASTADNQFLIRASGGVGIGAANPSAELDVAGTVQMTGFKMPISAYNGYVLTSDVSGVGTWQPAPGGGIGGIGTANYLPKFTAPTTLGNSILYETGGNIGIATTIPSEKLEINGNLKFGSTDDISILWGNGDVSINVDYDENSEWIQIKNLNTNGDVRIYSERYTELSGGNVGIGLGDPHEKLEVAGTVQMTGFKMPTNANNGYVLTCDGTGIGTWQPAPGGGNGWSLSGNSGTTPGTNFLGTTDNKALVLKVNSQSALQLLPAAIPNIICGSGLYYDGVIGATISGGGLITVPNIVTDSHGTVGGGYGNRAGDYTGTAHDNTCATVGGGASNIASRHCATVAGGGGNEAKGYMATISGGGSNQAEGYGSTVAGGELNHADGDYSMVPGGHDNYATGSYSFAAGLHAKANHNGTFVWADATDEDFASTADNQFLIRASGGVGIGTTPTYAKLTVNAGDNFSYAGNFISNDTGVIGHGQCGVAGVSLSFIGEPCGVSGAVMIGIGVIGKVLEGGPNSYGVYSIGDLAYTGDLIHISDAKFQENGQPLTGALAKIKQLHARTFTFTENSQYDNMNLPEGKHYGFIAQEVEQVLPDLVRDKIHPSEAKLPIEKSNAPPISYKGMNYVELIPLLVQAIKEQQEQIEELKAEIKVLQEGN